MRAPENELPAMLKKSLLLCCLLFTVVAHGEDNALAAAVPDVTALKAEECNASQSRLMASFGLGQMACTLSQYVNFDSLGKSLGISAFQSNSRTNPLAPSDNIEEFVRYSPAFFVRVNELYMQDTDRLMYRFIYNNFLANSTRLFYLNGKHLRDSRQLQGVTMAQYKQAIYNKNLGAEATTRCKNIQTALAKNSTIKQPYAETFQQCGKSGTATLFWYRRQLDGSNEALFTLLDNILKTQDGAFYQQIHRVKTKSV